MTLISAGNSTGVYGRCDAKCYGAKHPHCHCICGGRNHGAGLDQAMANTSEQAEAMMQEYREEHHLAADAPFKLGRIIQEMADGQTTIPTS